MQEFRVVCRFVVALHAVLFGVCPALAQTSTVSEPAVAALHVRGPAGCVQADAIESQVHQRSQRIQFVPAAANVPGLNVDVQRPGASTVAAELTVSWPDKRRSRRMLAADSCDEATSAVAFLIALTLDPAAFTQPGAAAREAGSVAAGGTKQVPLPAVATGAQESGASSADGPGDAGRAAATEPGAAEVGASETRAADSAPTPDEDSRTFELEQIGFGVAAQLTSGAAPNLMPGVSASVAVAFRGHGLFAPALQLSAAHVWFERAQPGGVAAFQRTTVRLDVCPIGLRGGALTARACLTSAAGSLNAQGSASYSPRTSARGWLDLGASLLASFDLGPVFQALGGVALVVPLRRDRFAFSPDVFHRVDVLCWEGHLGLGVRFP